MPKPRRNSPAHIVDINDVLSPEAYSRRAWIGERHVVGMDSNGYVGIGKAGTTFQNKPVLVEFVGLDASVVLALFEFLQQNLPPRGPR